MFESRVHSKKIIVTTFLLIISCVLFLALSMTSVASKTSDRALGFVQLNLTVSITAQSLVPTISPSPTPIPSAPWSLGLSLIINNPKGVWLRQDANSQSTTIVAVLKDNTNVVVIGSPQSDTVQWWWRVSTSNNQFAGWVEENSLGPTGRHNWKTNKILVINNLGGVWLREKPSSNSLVIIATIPNNKTVTIVGGPAHDYTQWWWQIRFVKGKDNFVGWVEQNALKEQLVPTQRPTSQPIVTLELPTPEDTGFSPPILPATETQEPDADFDGFPDSIDKCPQIPATSGSLDGCPATMDGTSFLPPSPIAVLTRSLFIADVPTEAAR